MFVLATMLLVVISPCQRGWRHSAKLEHRMLIRRCGRLAHARPTFERRIKSGCD
jgi:hypothetical protein